MKKIIIATLACLSFSLFSQVVEVKSINGDLVKVDAQEIINSLPQLTDKKLSFDSMNMLPDGVIEIIEPRIKYEEFDELYSFSYYSGPGVCILFGYSKIT